MECFAQLSLRGSTCYWPATSNIDFVTWSTASGRPGDKKKYYNFYWQAIKNLWKLCCDTTASKWHARTHTHTHTHTSHNPQHFSYLKKDEFSVAMSASVIIWIHNTYSVESTRWNCFGDIIWFHPKTKCSTFHIFTSRWSHVQVLICFDFFFYL